MIYNETQLANCPSRDFVYNVLMQENAKDICATVANIMGWTRDEVLKEIEGNGCLGCNLTDASDYELRSALADFCAYGPVLDEYFEN